MVFLSTQFIAFIDRDGVALRQGDGRHVASQDNPGARYAPS
jgi:hypothetical protein